MAAGPDVFVPGVGLVFASANQPPFGADLWRNRGGFVLLAMGAMGPGGLEWPGLADGKGGGEVALCAGFGAVLYLRLLGLVVAQSV